MDLTAFRTKAGGVIKKYRYALLILLLGLALMLLPELGKEEAAEATPQALEASDQTGELEKLLTQIQGVGKVSILLTMDTGQQTVYQSNVDGDRMDTVLVTDDSRAEQGLVQWVEYPKYRGAVVVCQGADDPNVRLAVVEAVCDATGLSSNKVTVVKMK